MKKPLTKEEFLEKRNTELHRELLDVFGAREEMNKMTEYLLECGRNKTVLFCDINRDLSIKFKPN